MSVTTRCLALSLALGLLWLTGCDGGGGDDPTPDLAGDTGPESDMAPGMDMGDPQLDMNPDAAELAPDAANPDLGELDPDTAPACADGEIRPCDVDGAEGCVGAQTCLDGVFGPCAVPPEVCDGADTDCNGAVDDVPGAGEACMAGVGACAAEGIAACGPAGELACDAVPGEPAEERCGTGADEDCDGQTDEDPCAGCSDDDHCADGELCIDAACVVGDCRADGDCGDGERCLEDRCRAPADEICDNGVDDDLDGATDCEDDGCAADPACVLPPSACDAPIPAPGPGLYAGDTTGGPAASQEADPDCAGASPAASAEVVYLFEPAEDGPRCFSTLGSTFDTVLYVRADACDDPAAEVACNHDNAEVAGPRGSALTLDAVAGTAYYVFVDGYGVANDGPYALRVTEGPCAPPVEICDNGINDDLDPQIDCEDPDCFGSDACLDLNCGNGARDPGEACDDGGRAPEDGCDATCLVEPGYACDAPEPVGPSVCRLVGCGDGVIDEDETCDDENRESGDGCDAVCTDEVYDAVRAVERFPIAFGDGDADAVRFTVDHDPGRLIARKSDGAGGCPGDTVIDVFPLGPDGRGPRIGGDDDGGVADCSLIDQALPAGAYEIVVSGRGGRAVLGAVLDYRLEVDISAGGTYDGAVDLGGTDLYVLELADATEVTLATGDGAGGCAGDSQLVLFGFDADGARLEITRSVDDPDDGSCAGITIELEPGVYEVEVDDRLRDAALAYVLQVDGIGRSVVEVAIRGFDMDPSPLNIPVGTTVRWTNFDAAVHTVTSGVPGDALAGAIFDSGDLQQGQSFEYRFQSPGVYAYFCRPHSGQMRDYAVIVDGGVDPALDACEESCADLAACFGVPDDQACVDGCMANPDNQATGRCLAEGLDPDAGRCDFAVVGACAN